MYNTEINLRLKALETAQHLTNWGRADTLLENAAHVENYLINGLPKTSSKDDTLDVDSLKINVPDTGLVQFNQWNHQKILWLAIENTKTLVVNTARQMGTTSLYSAYALHYAKTHPSSVVKVISNKFSTARNLVFLFADQITYKTRTQNSIVFDNNSIILCDKSNHSDDSVLEDCGMIDLLIIDNAAYIPFKEDEYINSLIVGKVKDKCIISSSPNVNAGLFYTLWNTPSQFRSNLMLPWYIHEKRDYKWASDSIEQLGHNLFIQEYGCQFKPQF